MGAPDTERRDGLDWRAGLCGICPAGCWIRAGFDRGRLAAVEPLPEHPLGTTCTIGEHAPQIVYDPDRLTTPLLRTGERGAGEFTPISWDAAYRKLVGRLQAIKAESGPEATAIYTGRGSFDMPLCDLFQPAGVAVSSASSVLFPFGSPNTLGVGALCYVAFAMIAPDATLGEMYITMDVDVEQAQRIVLWGANPATDSPPLLHEKILRARARGAEVIAIDPRRGATARQTDARWLPIRPGTDGALALSLTQVLIAEELYDEAFVERWTVGFAELAQLAQHYRPEVAAGITGVPAATIRALARDIAAARGAAPVMYTGLEYSDSGVQAIRAVLCLWALAGQLDVPGGLVIQMKGDRFPQNRSGLLPNPQPAKALGRDRFPVYSAYRGESHAIALPASVLDGDPYRIRALIVQGGSIITAWPQPDIWRRTLAALDLLVVIDRYPTADAAYADLILPATTGFENLSYMRYGPLFKIRERLVEPQGQARNDFLILAELARRLGYGHLFPQTEEAILAHALAGSGHTLEQVRAAGGQLQLPGEMMQYRKWEKGLLREDGRPGFATPSGKLEIASSLLAEHGYDPLPVYTEPAEGPLARPDLARRFPLVLGSGTRTPYDFRSQHHGVAGLGQAQPEPEVQLHPRDAVARGIADGDRVWVESPRGRVGFRARLTEDLMPGCVDAQMGGGGPLGPEAWQSCNVNELTDLERFDPISGFPIYKTLLCQVSRAAEQSEGAAPVRPDGPETAAAVEPESVAPQQRVYLDHNATSPVLPEVLAAMEPYLSDVGANPSSIHSRGALAAAAVAAARRKLAQLLGCTARRIVFCGSGSEADNLALKGVLHRVADGPRRIVTSAVEHPAVLEACAALEREGVGLTVLPVDGAGVVEPAALEHALAEPAALVSIMAANNETGALQPIAELARVAHARGALLHTDAVQLLGKVPIDVDALGVDLLTVSAHKIGGPKGVGALFVRRGLELEPLVHGGGQEWGLRAGTENVPGIAGFGKACELAQRRLLAGEPERLARLRDRLEAGLLELVAGARVNGPGGERLPNTSNLTLPGIRGESLVLLADRLGVAFSSGSACKSGDPTPSHALRAMGLSEEQAHCSVRLSLGPDSAEADVERCIAVIAEVLEQTQDAIRFVSCR